jgi:hypothetical protein
MTDAQIQGCRRWIPGVGWVDCFVLPSGTLLISDEDKKQLLEIFQHHNQNVDALNKKQAE